MSFLIYIILISLTFFAFFVISSRNPIHSVLSLISVFLLAAVLLICLEVEFLAFSFVIVYVGAIAILFLFVVMMLDIKIGDDSLDLLLKYGPLSYFLSFAFILEIILPILNFGQTSYFQTFSSYSWLNWCAEMHCLSNIQSIGQVLYTYYFVFFLMAGLILFIAALGALMLTVTLNKYSKKKLIRIKMIKNENLTIQHKKNIVSYLKSILPIILSCGYNKKTLVITVKPEDLFFVLMFLKQHSNTQYSLLTSVSGVDYPYRKKRFEVCYELLSVCFNTRVRVKTFVDEITSLKSASPIFPAATWWEREIWDLYGVFFEQNDEIKRILTDYGFEGHPLRKDFPLSGYVESRYDDSLKRVVCEPLEHAQEFRSFDFTSGWSLQSIK